MISIPLFIFLAIYALIVVASIALWCVNIYHIIASASMTPVAFFVSSSIALLGVLIIGGTALLLSDMNWDNSLPLFDSNPFTVQDFSYDRP